MKFYRIPNLYSMDAVVKSKVVIFGAGSVGSWVVSKLAYPWGKMVIADPQTLGKENVERHWLGTSHIGQSKAEGCKEMLVEHGVPERSVLAIVGTDDAVYAQHSDAKVAIITVDNVDVKYRINAWCMEHRIPMIIGSVYAQGLGGQVVVLPKPDDVCFLCAQAALGNLEYKGHPVGQNYGFDPTLVRDTSGAPKAVPALSAPAGVIADYMAMLVMDLIAKGGDIPPQVLMFGFNDWMEARRIRPGKPLNALTEFIVSMGSLGMVRSMQLGAPISGYVPLSVRNNTFPLALSRWTQCYMHSQQRVISADSI